MKAIYWFQTDLRWEDHAGLRWLSEQEIPFVGVAFEPNPASVFRKTFFWQTIADLRQKLQTHGVDIYVFQSPPEEALVSLAKENGVSFIGKSESFSGVHAPMARKLESAGLTVKSFSTQTLLEESDLPFSVNRLPLVFTDFRKAVEKNFSVRALLEAPLALRGFSVSIPSSLVLAEAPRLAPLPFGFVGGSTAAKERLEEYFFETKSISHYKLSRNGMIEKNDSSKFSPWLALGAISPRTIYWKLKEYEAQFGANESTYWLVFELLWRDYFKFLAKRFGGKIFSRQGLRTADRDWSTDVLQLQKWKEGKTDSSFVNANMKELLHTGWMSNRGRQNVASYLAKTLRIDWTLGAQWFEERLLDFDRESNWGNWLYQSGMGTDPRDRVFDVDRQAKIYDPEGKYQSLWSKR